MRSANFATLVRVLMMLGVIYLIMIKFNPISIIIIIAIMMLLDAVDGYLAVSEASGGSVGLGAYARAAMGNANASSYVKRYKQRLSKSSPLGARIDVAGDRIIELLFWITFTYLHLIPLFILIIIIIRHSFVDALMAGKGTSSKMKTKFARIVYSSSIGRGGINVVKFLTFSYLVLVYVSGYPIIIGYILVTILVAYILLRGLAEIYEVIA
jgi:phosphatidylglycerophosphate synthase